MTNCQHQPNYAAWNSSGTPAQCPAQSNFSPSTSYFQPHHPAPSYSQQYSQPDCSQQHSHSHHSQQHAQPNYSQHAQQNYSQQQSQPTHSQQHGHPDRPQQRGQQLQQPDPVMSQSDVDEVLKSMKNFVCPRGCFPPGMVDNMTYNPHNSINNTRNPARNTGLQQNNSNNQSLMPNNHITHNANIPQNHNYSQDGQCSNNYTHQRNHNNIPQNTSYQGYQKSHDQCSHNNPQNREFLAHIPGHMKPQQVYQHPSGQEVPHKASGLAQQNEPHFSALQHLHDGQEVHRCAKTLGNMCGEGNISVNKSEDMFPVICRNQMAELQPVDLKKNGLRAEKTDGLQGRRTRAGPPNKGWLIGPSIPKPRPKRAYC